jgi:threonine/homoserine/homoserine lactone efflux protein
MGYGTFLVFAALLVIAPGPDLAVVLKNALVGGRRRGMLAAAGVVSSSLAQGTAAALGLGLLIVRSQWLFQTIRWAGVVYLCCLGIGALVSACRGRYSAADPDPHRAALRGWRQGFLSNITNPKVLVFYLSVLPQFLHPGQTSVLRALALAYTHTALALVWLALVVTAFHRIRERLRRRPVRRLLDALTGTALLGFGARLATQ